MNKGQEGKALPPIEVISVHGVLSLEPGLYRGMNGEDEHIKVIESWRKHGNPRILSAHWYWREQHHRADGPAIEWSDGTKEWFIHGRRHRIGGPAYEDGVNNTRQWWVDGKCHRTDGAAVEYGDGSRDWWVDGERWFVRTIEELKARTKT